MHRGSACLIIITLLTAGFAPVAGRGSLKQFGKIKGTVVDINNARIVHAEVLVVGEGFRWSLITNTNGDFETSLPIGEYEMTVEAEGFSGSAPQKFRIKSGKTQRFNIQLLVKKPKMLVPAVADPRLNS